MKERGRDIETYLHPLKSIHLHSYLDYEIGVNSDVKIIYTFSAIAVVILLIACINFMNLATARSENRAKEVGLRKVLGAERKKIISQFLGESFVYAVLSLIFAVLAAQTLLPYFESLTGRDISIHYLQMPYLYAGLAGIVLFIGFAAGSYPALFLSAFKPVTALRGNLNLGPKRSWFRSMLVVFQFAVSTILIIYTIVIFNQQKYMRNKDLGFEKQNLLVLVLHNEKVRLGLESFKSEILAINGVHAAGSSSMVPGERYLFSNNTFPEGFSKDQPFRMDHFLVDYGFLDTFKARVIKGRGFSKDIITDKTEAVMINETAARMLEWENPVGKRIEINWRDKHRPDKKTIIGVFRDIHQRSLYAMVSPTFIQYISDEGAIENRARRLVLRVDSENLGQTMKLIEKNWKENYPSIPFYYFFLDEFYHSQHRAEEKLGRIYRSFSIIAVIIGCIGLFGLASFMAERRTKEIGIRKVLGSSAGSILVLLCREFIILIAIANVIAWPVAYFVINNWLQNFPYATNIQLITFILTAVLTLIIAVFTVGYQSIKAARANPVDSLRYE
jgi:putative ABC transport system permease protein